MKWTEFSTQVREYEERWPLVPVIMVGGCIFGVIIGASIYLPLIFLFWAVSLTAGFVYESKIALRCPYCRRVIKKDPRGGDSQLLILKNMHQCPHCQNKFE